jgi:pimeloyl-ACP methyl ester carboxylesterase
MSSSGMASVPDPTASYAEAVARFQENEQAASKIVNSVSGSRLLTHGERTPRVYVLIHGITNSPLQWQELGQTLYDKGHNVLILRMPYHGLQSGQVSELKRLTGRDLRAYADQTIDLAAGLGDEMVVAGISGGAAVAAWAAANRAEVDRALLLAPFFGIRGVPAFANTLLMNAFSRLPNLSFDSPSEPRREWVYRGEASRGVAAFLTLGKQVQRETAGGSVPSGEMIVVTTAVDNTANNDATAALLDRWQQAGVPVTTFEFGPDQDIPHNSVDPAADPVKKRVVYDKILNLLGE